MKELSPGITVDTQVRHGRPVIKGTLLSIIKQSKLAREEFLKLL